MPYRESGLPLHGMPPSVGIDWEDVAACGEFSAPWQPAESGRPRRPIQAGSENNFGVPCPSPRQRDGHEQCSSPIPDTSNEDMPTKTRACHPGSSDVWRLPRWEQSSRQLGADAVRSTEHCRQTACYARGVESPGCNTTGSVVVSSRTRCAQASASCAMSGHVLKCEGMTRFG